MPQRFWSAQFSKNTICKINLNCDLKIVNVALTGKTVNGSRNTIRLHVINQGTASDTVCIGSLLPPFCEQFELELELSKGHEYHLEVIGPCTVCASGTLYPDEEEAEKKEDDSTVGGAQAIMKKPKAAKDSDADSTSSAPRKQNRRKPVDADEYKPPRS